MEFFLRLTTDQTNTVLRGLEVLREQALATHTYVVQQVQSQAAVANTPPAPPLAPPSADEAPAAIDTAPPSSDTPPDALPDAPAAPAA